MNPEFKRRVKKRAGEVSKEIATGAAKVAGATRDHVAQKLEKPIGRREFVRDALTVLVGTVLFGRDCGKEKKGLEHSTSTPSNHTTSERLPEDNTVELGPQVEAREYEPPADIEYFRDLHSGVLVLTANASETAAVNQTLHERSSRRAGTAKYHFERSGALLKATTKTRQFADRDRSHQPSRPLRDVPVNIIGVDNLSSSVAIRNLQGRRFNLVQLRGHTSDMKHLFKTAQQYMNDKSLLILGGCEGANFISDFYSPDHPIIGDTYVGESAVNTYMLVRLIDEIGVSESWEDLYTKIAGQADLRNLGLIMPGDPRYRDFVER
ncbi:MAG: hypothetical protein A2458_03005 [Candidatus Kerfeldbacteria bacterium RIFOXYC2_FULL_38_9]|uniref:Uncharacterized protein n=1 Tax=Candidatus Kerfeldbacteria bacterium RIFOXYB2_FULL_38_14 TaxID=1798547 RepID=A0A1G2BEE4_9BACT|nr:MAG: hypothetical protein A2319_03185 [Candidatus Kerfeldbacteria bacterium RIFOXYB2_FULL_38_14]OGY89512.1 MAG: hypothetical protein A2458_03005 [Candidatus Kerfeldbacteria bacterium RIFOXYC2_FULL_38_9]